MFNCSICGSCCRSIGKVVISAIAALDEAEKNGDQIHPILDELASFPYDITDQGACTQLDPGGFCKVYMNRPLICNVDKMYEKFWTGIMTRDEYYTQSHASCDKLRRRLHGSKLPDGNPIFCGKDSTGGT